MTITISLLEWLYLALIIIGVVGAVLTSLAHYFLLALILCFVALPIPQFIIYPAALMSALDYASALRLAFDRERGKVIDMMGLSLLTPTSQKQERDLWEQLQKW